MGEPKFWDNAERAQKHIARLNTLKRSILPVAAFQKKVDEAGLMVELVEGTTAPTSRTRMRANWTRPSPAWSRSSTGWRSPPS